MTASITHCWKSAPEPAQPGAGLAARLLFLVLLVLALSAQAGSIAPLSASLTAGDEGSYQLTAEFEIDLGARLEEAVSRGVPLYFNLEFELTRPRWYWTNEHIAGKTIVHRLSYNALTRQYRLSAGALYQNFATFEEALGVLRRVRVLHVAEKGELKQGEAYLAALRLSLDKTQLPKPFQVDAIANRDWHVDTKVLNWQFVAGEAK